MRKITGLFAHTFRSAEEESEHYRKVNPASDKKVIWICVVVALSLTFIKYFGDDTFFTGFLRGIGLANLSEKFFTWTNLSENARLNHLAWWVFVIIFFYFIVPFLLIKFIFRERLSDYGLKWKGAFKDYYLYVIMLVVMVPLVLFFSTTHSFQERYPFYKLHSNENFYPNFYLWELLYFLQFFSLEFFFRGFMLHGIKHRFGFYSVFVMTIPYCMIHFGKPLPETISAIAAGIVLGTVSLKSRSILLGVCIHYSVAIAMDLCALWREGLL